MTVTTFNATFEAGTVRYHGNISWDKHSPQVLRATIAKHLENGTDWPEWEATAKYGPKGQARLVSLMMKGAAELGAKLTESKATEFAPTIQHDEYPL